MSKSPRSGKDKKHKMSFENLLLSDLSILSSFICDNDRREEKGLNTLDRYVESKL